MKSIFLILTAIVPVAFGESGSFTNAGGSASGGGGIYISGSPVSNPPGTLGMSCIGTGPMACSDGNITFNSTDGTSSFTGTFTTGSYAESCAGGGKGGHVSCGYTLSGTFTGTWTLNGVPQAIIGTTYQSFNITNPSGAYGTTSFNSAYTPFYYSDSEQIHRSDDLMGTNQISYDGAAYGGFYGAYGLALDSQGRIYISDTYHCRIVRIDDMTGANGVIYGGTCGAGQGQFYDPQGIAIDSLGRIYIMDTGNSRLVRIDDLTGANWTVFSNVGTGTGQLAQYVNVAVDSSFRIYIPDAGRLVRMDDMTGANFTTLTQSPNINGYIYSFADPAAVAIDSTGRIYVADDGTYQPSVVRVDDMTGTNWTGIYLGSNSGTTNAIGVDSGNSAFLSGGGAKIIPSMGGVLYSSGAIGPIGSYYVFGITPIPQPSPRPSAIMLTPNPLNISQNLGSTSPSQPLRIYNFGGSPMTISNVSISGAGFAQTNNCLGTLTAGAACTVNVTFTPAAKGTVNGTVTVTDTSGNAGTSQTAALTGTGTAPAASINPLLLSFGSVVYGTTSAAKTVTLTDSGTGPLTISNIGISGPFSQTNNCPGTLAPNASCTFSVTYTPDTVGSDSGAITITDNAGTGSQKIALSGTGGPPVTFLPNPVNFGSVAVGNLSAAKTITITNRLPTVLSISNIAISGTGFAISNNPCGSSIAVGGNCTVSVTFTPAALGSASGALTLTDSALTSPQTVNLSGTGVAPVTLSASTLNFGSVVTHTTSAAKNVTLTNNQSAALNFVSIAAGAPFNIATNSCGTSIGAFATCTIGVTFAPGSSGPVTGTLSFTDDASNNPQNVTLNGTGIDPVTLSTNNLTFGTISVGSSSLGKSVTLTNNQTISLSSLSVAASANFTISSNSCGTSLSAGKSCSVTVKFSPTTTGTINGSLTFTDSAANSPQTVSLGGTGK